MADEYNEYIRNYSGGWGRIRSETVEGAPWRTFKILEFGGLENKDAKVNIEIINPNEASSIHTCKYSYLLNNAEWFYPESKYINTPNFVVRCVAYPNRQYSKALTHENCYFSEALPFKLNMELEKLTKPSIADILSNYDKEYPAYISCFEDLATGKAVARAFAKRFLITSHPECPFPLLVHKNVLIGYDRGDLLICIPRAEKLNDTLISLTRKGVTYNESR